MDRSVYRPLKLKYEKELIQWPRKHYGCKMTSQIILKIWTDINANIIYSGLRKASIFPFCDSVVSKESYEPQ